MTLRDGPSLLRVIERTVSSGETVNVVCQIGTPAGRWDKLHDGSFVPDAAVASETAKPTVPPCAVPFQVRAKLAQQRTGPGIEYAERSLMPSGALAWIQCETPGITLGRPGYWASLAGGGWISGAPLARPQLYQRSLAVPLCELGNSAPGSTSTPTSPPAPISPPLWAAASAIEVSDL